MDKALSTDQVIQNNRLISEFMVGIFGQHENYGTTLVGYQPLMDYKEDTSFYFYDEMRFHISWDWLMPVVERIENLGFEFQIESRNSPVLKEGNPKISIVSISKTFKTVKEITDRLENIVESQTVLKYYDKPSEKLGAVYEAVAEFIQRYNQQKTEKDV